MDTDSDCEYDPSLEETPRKRRFNELRILLRNFAS